MSFNHKGHSLTYYAGANDLPEVKQTLPFLPRRRADAFENDACRFPQGLAVVRHGPKVPRLGWVKMTVRRAIRALWRAVPARSLYYHGLQGAIEEAEWRPPPVPMKL